MKPDIHVHIEELVLDGFAPRDRYRISEAVEQELARLIAKRGLNPALVADVERPSLRVNAVQCSRDGDPNQLGQKIARSVFGEIGRGEENIR